MQRSFTRLREKVSSWTMGGLIHLLTTSGFSTISDTLEKSVDDEGVEQKEKQITSMWEAKAAAYWGFKKCSKASFHVRRLAFLNLSFGFIVIVCRTVLMFIIVIWSRHIDVEDLLRFMNMEEVDNVLPLFEGAVQMGETIFLQLGGKITI